LATRFCNPAARRAGKAYPAVPAAAADPARRRAGFDVENRSQSGSAKAMIVNLNKYKKKRARTEGERRAAENRVRFGRSKAARAKDRREHEQAEESLENKRLD
jgi:Domain of unknown function (DUF4169)